MDETTEFKATPPLGEKPKADSKSTSRIPTGGDTAEVSSPPVFREVGGKREMQLVELGKGIYSLQTRTDDKDGWRDLASFATAEANETNEYGLRPINPGLQKVLNGLGG